MKKLKDILAPMTLMEKVEYIAAYYWIPIAAAVFAVIALVWGVGWMNELRTETIFSAALMDSAWNAEEAQHFSEAFEAYLGENNPFQKVTLDTSLIYLPPSQSNTRMYGTYISKELMLEEMGLDVYLTPIEFYEESKARAEDFRSLRELLGGEYANYQDCILDDTALVLTDSRLSRESAAKYETIYLTVPKEAAHPEKIIQFIHFLQD